MSWNACLQECQNLWLQVGRYTYELVILCEFVCVGPFVVVIYLHVRTYACLDGCLDVSVCGCAHGYMDKWVWMLGHFYVWMYGWILVFFFVSASLDVCLLSSSMSV